MALMEGRPILGRPWGAHLAFFLQLDAFLTWKPLSKIMKKDSLSFQNIKIWSKLELWFKSYKGVNVDQYFCVEPKGEKKSANFGIQYLTKF